MKTCILTFVVLLSAAISGYAQELRFSRAQIDSIIAQAAVTYESPTIDSIRLEGTVEDLAAKYAAMDGTEEEDSPVDTADLETFGDQDLKDLERKYGGKGADGEAPRKQD